MSQELNQVVFKESEAAKILGCHRQTMRMMRLGGQVKCINTDSGVRYTAWALAEYMRVPVEKLLEQVRGK